MRYFFDPQSERPFTNMDKCS
uniref:Uncharacterized protein n=1 Tax=Tetranychus urticae TaxID=32264 RepID=T1KJ87_TETUR